MMRCKGALQHQIWEVRRCTWASKVVRYDLTLFSAVSIRLLELPNFAKFGGAYGCIQLFKSLTDHLQSHPCRNKYGANERPRS
eukprot:scaffold112007_cov39-Prasinocladus_malaysianus.AAC.3